MSNTIVKTFRILTPLPEQKRWLVENLAACIRIRKLWEDQLVANPISATLFGIKLSQLSRAVPEAAKMSSYVNFGMMGRSMDDLLVSPNSFRYRSTNKSCAVYQAEDLSLYVSGYPSAKLELDSPDPLPEGLNIVTLTFTYRNDLPDTPWDVTVAMKTPRSVRARPPKYSSARTAA